MDGVDEPLDAGKVGGVEQERRFPAQLCGSVQQGKGVGLLQVLADAGRQSRRQLELVVEGNIPVLVPRGAGRQAAALGFQQAQQRVCLRRAELQAGELPGHLLIELPVNGGGDVRRILHGVVQGTVRAGSRDGIPGVLPVQVAENGAQGPEAGAGRFGGGGVGGHRQAAGKGRVAGGVRPCGCGLVGPEGQLAKAVQQAAEGGLQGECVQGIIFFGQCIRETRGKMMRSQGQKLAQTELLPAMKGFVPIIARNPTKKNVGNREMNCTPFVRQYGILFRKWGVLYAREEKANDI